MPRLRLLLFFLFFTCLSVSSFSQLPDPFFESIVSKVSYDTVLANLQKLESLGVKEPGTSALDNTANWLIQKYQSYGYTQIVRDTFEYNGNQLYNIIVSKQGTSFPPRYLIIDGHYDTYQGPGVNDNGSGVACILEIARLLKDIPSAHSIRFINFSAEEEGLIGSQHFVDHTVVPSNMNILLVFNIDEVGGVAGQINNTVTCERDESNPSSNNAISSAFTDTLVNLTQIYSTLQTQISYAYGSDYVPFQEAGKIITGLYETNESSFVHSPNDVLAKMSPLYVTQVAKASVGAALHFSGAYQLNTLENSDKIVSAALFPNPAGNLVKWQFSETHSAYSIRILDEKGSCLMQRDYSEEEECRAEISQLNPGIFALQFLFENGTSTTVKLIKTIYD
jgi:aminopeptidase YwaD